MNLGDIKWPGSDSSARNGDAVNENARRIAAIANEGLQGQPWLEELKTKPRRLRRLDDSYCQGHECATSRAKHHVGVSAGLAT